MGLITKANAETYLAKARAAKARKRTAIAEANALADSILKSGPNAQACLVKLVHQQSVLDELILGQMVNGHAPAKLERLVKVQGMLLSQIAKAQDSAPKPGERVRSRMLEPLKAMAERNPAIVTAALRPMLEPAKPAKVSTQPEPEPTQPEASQDAQPSQVEPTQPDDPASLFG